MTEKSAKAEAAASDDLYGEASPLLGPPTEPVSLYHENQEFPDLTKLIAPSGSLSSTHADPDAPIQTEHMYLPTLSATMEFGNNKFLHERRQECIALGAPTIDKQYLFTAQPATRRMFRTIFTRELDILDDILFTAEHRARKVEPLIGYRVQGKTYQLLLLALSSFKITAEDSFRAAGQTPPSLPSWGHDDDIEDYYSLNDYEILGVCFRVEVENYLAVMEGVYDFYRHKSRIINPEALKNAEEVLTSKFGPRKTPRPDSFGGQASTAFRGTPPIEIPDPVFNPEPSVEVPVTSTPQFRRNPSLRWGSVAREYEMLDLHLWILQNQNGLNFHLPVVYLVQYLQRTHRLSHLFHHRIPMTIQVTAMMIATAAEVIARLVFPEEMAQVLVVPEAVVPDVPVAVTVVLGEVQEAQLVEVPVVPVVLVVLEVPVVLEAPEVPVMCNLILTKMQMLSENSSSA
ncbi:hypothetical protein C8F01DRAFT_1260816 [Mycena amicta]|nr:hypothetical protein C8F01DRAFT_1260816 [Mycena amicta]